MKEEIAASVVSTVAYFWLAAWVWHVLPESRDQWWEFPAAMTTVAGAVVSYWWPLLVRWK